jgi:hypothetical protein
MKQNLVPCPVCGNRRDCVDIQPDRNHGGEIRVFVCRPCRATSRYLFGRNGADLIEESRQRN